MKSLPVHILILEYKYTKCHILMWNLNRKIWKNYKKSIDKAKRNLITVPVRNGTLPHDILGKYKSSSILLKPACAGTGIIAGGPVRAIMDAIGASDVISKSLGSSSPVNVVRATFDALENLMDAKTVAANRGKSLQEMWG